MWFVGIAIGCVGTREVGAAFVDIGLARVDRVSMALVGAVGTRCVDTSVRTMSDRLAMGILVRRSMGVSTGVVVRSVELMN